MFRKSKQKRSTFWAKRAAGGIYPQQNKLITRRAGGKLVIGPIWWAESRSLSRAAQVTSGSTAAVVESSHGHRQYCCPHFPPSPSCSTRVPAVVVPHCGERWSIIRHSKGETRGQCRREPLHSICLRVSCFHPLNLCVFHSSQGLFALHRPHYMPYYSYPYVPRLPYGLFILANGVSRYIQPSSLLPFPKRGERGNFPPVVVAGRNINGTTLRSDDARKQHPTSGQSLIARKRALQREIFLQKSIIYGL